MAVNHTYGVMVTSNPLSHKGGIVQFFKILLKNWDADDIRLIHHPIGSRPGEYHKSMRRYLQYPFLFMSDLLAIRNSLRLDKSIRILHVNASLSPLPLIRDAFLMHIARRQQCRTLLFIHGWKEHVFEDLARRGASYRVFKLILSRADAVAVLAERFREAILKLYMVSCPIYVLSTMFDKRNVVLPSSSHQMDPPRLLYSGRIAQIKGCGELIDAASLLRDRGIGFSLTVVGDGDRSGFMQYCQRVVKERNLDDCVKFTGYLAGSQVWRAYAEHDIFVFPSWTEGCPTVVLEALASGLFCVTTNVGALREIIEDSGAEGNGCFVKVGDSLHLANNLSWAIDHLAALRGRRLDIHRQAMNRFESLLILKKVESIYRYLLSA